MKKKILICGAGGFIGHHLVKYFKKKKFTVYGADIKYPEYEKTLADQFYKYDLRNPENVKKIFNKKFDEVYQLAADMGGAGYIFSGDNDAEVMNNSAMINLNVLNYFVKSKSKKIFYSSSACIYPEYNQINNNKPITSESSAYPAMPDSEYGWEKLFSERLYLSYRRNKKINVKIARFHNIFGPLGSWNNGKEKAPAAICRKIAQAKNNSEIQIWGDGKQTRSFLYVDECIKGVVRLMNSKYCGPYNIGSSEMISINDLAKRVMKIAGKKLKIKHIKGPLGVRGRNSDNRLIYKDLKWKPKSKLDIGLTKTYNWINKQVNKTI